MALLSKIAFWRTPELRSQHQQHLAPSDATSAASTSVQTQRNATFTVDAESCTRIIEPARKVGKRRYGLWNRKARKKSDPPQPPTVPEHPAAKLVALEAVDDDEPEEPVTRVCVLPELRWRVNGLTLVLTGLTWGALTFADCVKQDLSAPSNHFLPGIPLKRRMSLPETNPHHVTVAMPVIRPPPGAVERAPAAKRRSWPRRIFGKLNPFKLFSRKKDVRDAACQTPPQTRLTIAGSDSPYLACSSCGRISPISQLSPAGSPVALAQVAEKLTKLETGNKSVTRCDSPERLDDDNKDKNATVTADKIDKTTPVFEQPVSKTKRESLNSVADEAEPVNKDNVEVSNADDKVVETVAVDVHTQPIRRNSTLIDDQVLLTEGEVDKADSGQEVPKEVKNGEEAPVTADTAKDKGPESTEDLTLPRPYKATKNIENMEMGNGEKDSKDQLIPRFSNVGEFSGFAPNSKGKGKLAVGPRDDEVFRHSRNDLLRVSAAPMTLENIMDVARGMDFGPSKGRDASSGSQEVVQSKKAKRDEVKKNVYTVKELFGESDEDTEQDIRGRNTSEIGASSTNVKLPIKRLKNYKKHNDPMTASGGLTRFPDSNEWLYGEACGNQATSFDAHSPARSMEGFDIRDTPSRTRFPSEDDKENQPNGDMPFYGHGHFPPSPFPEPLRPQDLSEAARNEEIEFKRERIRDVLEIMGGKCCDPIPRGEFRYDSFLGDGTYGFVVAAYSYEHQVKVPNSLQPCVLSDLM